MTKPGEIDIAAEDKVRPAAVQLALFASGGGSNAAQIIRYFENHPGIDVSLLATNKPEAGAVHVATAAGIPVLFIDKERFFKGDGFAVFLKERGIDFIVLAGFLWKVPLTLINAFKGKIINIHPALLPKFGGKGMYGQHVHQAVIEGGETETGITIHYVDELYDHGAVIFQANCPVLPNDTATSLAQRVLTLEHRHYPAVIESVIQQKSFV